MSGDLEVGQIELTVEENLQPTIQPLNQKTVIRIGSLLIIFSVAGMLNPPMTVSSLQHRPPAQEYLQDEYFQVHKLSIKQSGCYVLTRDSRNA